MSEYLVSRIPQTKHFLYLLLDGEGDSPLYPGGDWARDGEVEHQGQVTRPAPLPGPEHGAGVQHGVRGLVTWTHQHWRHPGQV